MKKKCTCLSLAGLFVTLLLGKSSPAFAAPLQVAVSHAPSIQTTSLTSAELAGTWHAPWRFGHHHTNNQYLGGHCNSHSISITRYLRGNNLSNSGNKGHNRGLNQDNSSNDGNQLINAGRGYQGHNQYYKNCITVEIRTYNIGNDENNSGNRGYNSGHNEDNSSNLGNQIVD